MTVSWIEPTERLAAAAAGWDGLWSLLFAARRASLALAVLPGLDDDLAFTEAALDLGEAAEELKWLRADLPLRAAAVDLGDAPLDQITACRTAVVALLAAAHILAGQLHSAAGELDAPQSLGLARASQLVVSAHRRVAGRLP